MPKKAGLEKLIHLEHKSYKGLLQPRYLQFNLFKNHPAGGGEDVKFYTRSKKILFQSIFLIHNFLQIPDHNSRTKFLSIQLSPTNRYYFYFTG